MSKRGHNCFLFPCFLLLSSPSCQISARTKRNYVFCRLAYENQVCIRQIEHKNVIDIWVTYSTWWCVQRASFYGDFSRFYGTLTVNNFISVDFQTHVSIWFLIRMKFCTRIINTALWFLRLIHGLSIVRGGNAIVRLYANLVDRAYHRFYFTMQFPPLYFAPIFVVLIQSSNSKTILFRMRVISVLWARKLENNI